MKKSTRMILKTLFWLGFVAFIGWLVLHPKPPRYKPESLHVKVEQSAPVEEAPPEDVVAPAPTVPEMPAKPIGDHAHPQIAIVIDDLGLDMRDTKRAIDLPATITLSFLPYATRLKEQTKEARDAGHELMLHMPMEPLGHDNPGPGALLVGLPMEELRARFHTALASFTGFDGVNNHMGSKFTADPAGMAMVMEELQQRNLFFLDSRTNLKTVGEQMARQRQLPTIGRDVFLDDTITVEAVQVQLAQTERVAKRKGYAVAIGHPHTVTLDALLTWIPEAEKRGFAFVPVRKLVNHP